ncbi:hypothetical protein [Thalassotalea aquiviva]|uniref:DUF748 domain-containing protein n=1 Tax=Thalassotalea aquiviva TaxID=3242415 RepID=UPI00352BCD62
MNKLAIVAALLLAFFGAMLWYLASADWNGFVKSQVELHSSNALSREVQLAKVEMNMPQGVGTLYGLTVANNENQKQANLLAIDEVLIDINPETLTAAFVVIDSVRINKVHAFVELRQNNQSNIADILAFIEQTNSPNDAQEKPTKSKKKKVTKISIKSLIINDLTIEFTDQSIPPIHPSTTPIALEFIGGEQGVDANKLASEIAKILFEQIENATTMALESH